MLRNCGRLQNFFERRQISSRASCCIQGKAAFGSSIRWTENSAVTSRKWSVMFAVLREQVESAKRHGEKERGRMGGGG